MPSAACERCGFDATSYTGRDLGRAPVWLRAMTAQTVEGVDPDVLAAPSLDETRRALDHVVDGLGPAAGADGPGAGDGHAVHEALHLLRLLGRQLHEAGAGAPTHQGSVAQISTSDGGVPKVAVASADIGPSGVLGDRQADRRHHGRPFQAVCLWSAEVIDALRAEGHPVHPGAAGENLTLSGIDWSSLRPGVRLLAGEVLLELSAWATPCRKNDQWFTGRSDRIDHDRHPGWSRVYAWVLEPGTVRANDPAVVEP